MTTTTYDVPAVRATATPRGARVAAQLFARLAGWLRVPPKARPSSRAEEAAAVREFASRIQYSDPGFAADLFAAAARHEAMDD